MQNFRPARARRLSSWRSRPRQIGFVALALSLRGLDDGHGARHRELIVAMTYVVVVFSILVQGLTVGRLSRSLLRDAAGPGMSPDAAGR